MHRWAGTLTRRWCDGVHAEDLQDPRQQHEPTGSGSAGSGHVCPSCCCSPIKAAVVLGKGAEPSAAWIHYNGITMVDREPLGQNRHQIPPLLWGRIRERKKARWALLRSLAALFTSCAGPRRPVTRCNFQTLMNPPPPLIAEHSQP